MYKKITLIFLRKLLNRLSFFYFRSLYIFLLLCCSAIFKNIREEGWFVCICTIFLFTYFVVSSIAFAVNFFVLDVEGSLDIEETWDYVPRRSVYHLDPSWAIVC